MNITLEWMHNLVELIKGRFLRLQKRLGLWGSVCVCVCDAFMMLLCKLMYLILS